MAVTNHERVGKALELLNQGLLPFIERELKAKNERVVFLRKSLFAIADEIRRFDALSDTFGPPTRALQEAGRRLIRASHKKGRTIEREFMLAITHPVAHRKEDQFRIEQKMSVLEFERIAEEITENDILPEFHTETWIIKSLENLKERGEAILSDYSDENDMNWKSARDLWSGDARRWIEIFVSRHEAHEFMRNIDYGTERGRLESHLQNLEGITVSLLGD